MRLPFFIALLIMSGLMACKEDETPDVYEPKQITRVQLIFSDKSGGAPITVSAEDPDGAGPLPVQASAFGLKSGTAYDLFIKLENELTDEDVAELVEAAATEHMLFYAFDDQLFASPEGTGNMDDRGAQVNYLDRDENGLPLGLITAWVTGEAGAIGSFRIKLQNQPNLKSETSTSDEGFTDLDLTWQVTLQ
ncbi:hypothetical protein [Marinoscillum furvescens]|uniref:Type 1 periplasmic binding fold superfamily protein n=1 Tax=Marinoscillum furvescens DSM 4134 TaxID=1122208 RepID=A0A3D9LK71_MARFU|nr:hypothetical protein [Marinoscillum furvescens]REE05642.1 hypothetical protein C7460_101159 [Marinoscillum furvescens DSM 4134]